MISDTFFPSALLVQWTKDAVVVLIVNVVVLAMSWSAGSGRRVSTRGGRGSSDIQTLQDCRTAGRHWCTVGWCWYCGYPHLAPIYVSRDWSGSVASPPGLLGNLITSLRARSGRREVRTNSSCSATGRWVCWVLTAISAANSAAPLACNSLTHNGDQATNVEISKKWFLSQVFPLWSRNSDFSYNERITVECWCLWMPSMSDSA